MSIPQDHLEVLRQNQSFQEVMKCVRLHTPVVPVYDHTDDNTEEWKANSNTLKGFNLVLSLLGEPL
jgi:hypothetical protein